MLFAYYPLACAFAVGPALATGVELDVHTAPFAALALVGLACAALASGDAAAKTYKATRLRRLTKLLAVLGAVNLVGGVAARVLAHEDKRMAWVFATFVSQKLANVNITPGIVYPFAVSMELLLEIVGVVIPSAPWRRDVLGVYAPTPKPTDRGRTIADRVRYESRRVNAPSDATTKLLARDILV